MFGIKILEIIIAIVFFYCIYSLLASWISDAVSFFINLRSKFLHKVIKSMLGGEKGEEETEKESLVNKLYNHPLIKELSNKEGKKPDDIPVKEYSMAVIDILSTMAKEDPDNRGAREICEIDIKQIEQGVLQIKSDFVREKLILLLNRAQSTGVIDFTEDIAQWFSDRMDQASKVYKKYILVFTFIIGTVLAGSTNFDSLYLIKELWDDAALRGSITEQAAAYLDTSARPEAGNVDIGDTMEHFESLQLPIGWTEEARDYLFVDKKVGLTGVKRVISPWMIIVKILGILISGLAVCQGAPFWYDILKRIIPLKPQAKKSGT